MQKRNWLMAAMLLTFIAFPVALIHAQAKPSKKSVTIKDMKFSPDAVEIKVGDTVVWTNNDDVDHTVVDTGGTFKSENIKPGKSFSFKFDKAGKFSYSCSYHPRMKGSVTVGADSDKDSKPAK